MWAILPYFSFRFPGSNSYDFPYNPDMMKFRTLALIALVLAFGESTRDKRGEQLCLTCK